MLLHLPTFHATLSPCSISPAAFTPHPDGKFCGSCQRVVQDFSRSENPVADLAAARAASPDGRVCGTFRREQIALPPATPTLSRRLRWFVMALVLVVGQGLTAREALAQVRKPVPHKTAVPHRKYVPAVKKKPVTEVPLPEEVYYTSGIAIDDIYLEEPSKTEAPTPSVYTYAEQMPQLTGGGGTAAIVAYIQQRARGPKEVNATDAEGRIVEGRVYAGFIVGKDGVVREAKIVKGLHPLLDAETIRAIQKLPAFTPGRQGGTAVDVSFTVPISFKIY